MKTTFIWLLLAVSVTVVCAATGAQAVPNDGITPDELRFAKDFMKYYHEFYPKLSSVTDRLKQRVKDVVYSLDFWIPPEYTARAKDPASVEGKLLGRLSAENFTEYDKVIERMHDMVGIRITTYFPSLEIPQIINLLHLHFDVIAVKPGGTPEYRGTNVHVRIENTDCEVQLRGAFEHAFYQIQHKFGYKVKGAPMTKEQNETVAALRKNAYDSEELLKQLLQSRNVRKPLVRESYTDNDESNEWSEAWNDVVRRRREDARASKAAESRVEL